MEKNFKNPLVSIIIPIYQVEQYIEAALESVCSQTYKEIEIIIVDDGSEDDSINIAKRVLEKYGVERYKIISQKNCGQSKARNVGILAAQGEWVLTIDSDDMITQNFIAEMVCQLKANSTVDFVICNFRMIRKISEGNYVEDNGKKEGKSVSLELHEDTRSDLLEGSVVRELFLCRKIPIIIPAVLIRKEYINKYNIFYDEQMRYSEDVQYIWKLLMNCKRCVYIRNKRYFYLRHASSIMRATSLSKIQSGYSGMIRYTKTWKNKKAAGLVMARWVLGALHSSAKILDYERYREFLEYVSYKRWMKKLKKFPERKARMLSVLFLLNSYVAYCCCKRM